MKKLMAVLMVFAIAAVAQAKVIATWTFPVSSQVSQDADSQDANLAGKVTLTRGAGAPATTGAGFRTTGFQNNGINVANTDFYQISLAAATGYELSLNSISGDFAGTPTFSPTPGVSHQWAYSFDDSSYTLIDNAVSRVGNGTSDFDFSGTSALQNIPASSTVYLRYYASGQTSTGGWGFTSAGFSVDGAVTQTIPEPATMSLLGLGALAMVLRRKMKK